MTNEWPAVAIAQGSTEQGGAMDLAAGNGLARSRQLDKALPCAHCSGRNGHR